MSEQGPDECAGDEGSRSPNAADIRQRPPELVEVEKTRGRLHHFCLLGEEFRVVTEYAATMESELKNDVDERFGEDAEESSQVNDANYKTGQWYSALVVLTEEESQDIVLGVTAGNGAEPRRPLV